MEMLALAEMANAADYSAMNYGELIATKNAINWAMANINPLLPKRRFEEMSKITHIYVTAMNGYFATKEEILACLNNEKIGNGPAYSSILDDVDDQDATVTTPEEKEGENTKGEAPITTPEPSVSIQDDIDVIAHMASLLETASKSEEVDETDSKTSFSEEEASPSIPKRKVKKDIVKRAIEMAKEMPVANGTDSHESYYVSYLFKRTNGELIPVDEIQGWNMDVAAMEKLKEAERMYLESRYRNVETTYVGNFIVYLLSNGKVRVSEFNKDDNVTPYHIDYTNYAFPNNLQDDIDLEKWVDEWLHSNADKAVSTNEGPALEESKYDTNESAPVEEEDPIIREAIKLAMSSPIPSGIDANASYFTQHTFDVMKDGKLVFKGKMFGDNVDADMLESIKMRHMNYASTMKGSLITSTADYTAYIEAGGKRVNVYLYHTPSAENDN